MPNLFSFLEQTTLPNTPLPQSKKKLARWKHLLFRFLLAIFLFNLFIALYYAYYYYRVRQLGGYQAVTKADYREPVFDLLTDSQIVNLGWAHSSTFIGSQPPFQRYPASSYLHFPFRKADSAVKRIGLFGCSYTEGAEVGQGYDFPSFLQKLYNEKQKGRYEIINFGVSSYGMHQSALLYEYLGKKYELDEAVVNLYVTHTFRDLRFVFDNLYFPVHARYILEGDSLRLITVEGKTRKEAAERYYSFFPSAHYLKYDALGAQFFKYWIPDYVLPNPFYYRSTRLPDLFRESYQSYGLLFGRMAKDLKKVTVLGNEAQTLEALQGKLPAKVEMLDLRPTPQDYRLLIPEQEHCASLLQAPKMHLNANGNQIRAQRVFKALTGTPTPIVYPVFKPALVDKAKKPALASFDTLYFEMNGRRFNGLRPFQATFFDERIIFGSPVAAHTLRQKQLLYLSQNHSDWLFLALDPEEQDLDEGDTLWLDCETEAGHAQSPIGLVQNVAANVFQIAPLPFAHWVTVHNVPVRYQNYHLPVFPNTPEPVRYAFRQHDIFANYLKIRAAKPIKTVCFKIDGQPLPIPVRFENTTPTEYQLFVKPDEQWYGVRLDGDFYLNWPEWTAATGFLNIVTEKQGERQTRPFLQWEMKKI